jgi:hypothetical protein
MKTVDDHNAARWLVVKCLSGVGGGGEERRDGWHVVRVCPCHWGESVTLALPSKEWAEDVRAVMLSVSPGEPAP